MGGRLAFLAWVAAQQVLAGTGRHFEVRVAGGKAWHQLRMTEAEAERIMLASAHDGRGHRKVAQLRAMRSRLEAVNG
jgi:hypothetical protein